MGNLEHDEKFLPPSGPPPQYVARNEQTYQKPIQEPSHRPDDPMWCLRGYDIVYIVDDSTLMLCEEKNSLIVPWPRARRALSTFASTCAAWDTNGQDLYFINSDKPVLNATPQMIEHAFNTRTPQGETNMGHRLMQVADKFFAEYQPGVTKPVNVIAITDGQFTDDVMSVIVSIVRRLDEVNAMPNLFGIQFVQIGYNMSAKKSLVKLDDDLERRGLSRDIVDTVAWDPLKIRGTGFDGNYLAKIVCGAINKRLDNDTVKMPKKSKLRLMFSLSANPMNYMT